jgi:hypothetical protein
MARKYVYGFDDFKEDVRDLKKEIRAENGNKLDTAQELTFAVGTGFIDALRAERVTPALVIGIGAVLWNYLDAVAAIQRGFDLLDNEDNYHQTENKIKGTLSILAGVQLLLLSYNPATGLVLAAPSFALSVGIDLVCTVIDYISASREVTEQRKELNNTLTVKNPSINSTPEACNKKLAERILKIQQRQKTICSDIMARTRVRFAENRVSMEFFQEIEKKYKLPGAVTTTLEEDGKRDREIQKEVVAKQSKHLVDMVVRTASFVGLTLLAATAFVACPPMLAVGLTLVSMVAIYNIWKHWPQIANTATAAAVTVSKNVNAFFNNAVKEAVAPISSLCPIASIA